MAGFLVARLICFDDGTVVLGGEKSDYQMITCHEKTCLRSF